MSRPAKWMLLLGCAAALLVGAPGGSEGAVAVPEGARDEPGGTGWNATATAFRGRNGARFVYTCPKYGAANSVWGTDVYTDDSSVCTAAVHTGRITLAGGGSVTIEIRPGQSSYTGSTRNYITTSNYGTWVGSYVIVAATPVDPGVGVGETGWDKNATAFRTWIGARFLFNCPATGKPGRVWGTDVYTYDSSVCTAAVHVGLITVAKGGSVTIEMRPGQDSYAGSTRHGITSSAYPKFGGSFVIVGAGPPTGSATGTVLVNGTPFTSGTISYGSTLNVTGGTLTLSTDVGTLLLYGDGKSLANAVMTRTFEGVGSKKQPIVELALTGGDFTVCGARRTSAHSPGTDNKTPKPKKTVRALWGKGNGHFRTKGRYSSAAVRGTNWLTADRCDGTLTQVKQGVVSVRDFTRKKTVNVRAGQSYLAPAHR